MWPGFCYLRAMKLLIAGIAAGIVAVLFKQQLNRIEMTTQEAIAKLNEQATKLEKVRVEVQALKDAAQNEGNVSPELEAAIARVDAALTQVDDINPDEVTPEEPTDPEAPIEG